MGNVRYVSKQAESDTEMNTTVHDTKKLTLTCEKDMGLELYHKAIC